MEHRWVTVPDEGEKPWALNNDRLKIVSGICGDAQEGSFGNATLQSTDNDPNLEFSVAVHVEVPDRIKTQEQLANYLGVLFGGIVLTCEVLHIEIQLGPAGNGEEDD